MPPNGVGGGGVHWNAETWRFLPSDFVLKTHLTERYGASFLPPDMTIQDWGVTYDDLEPHYDQFEYLCGTSGQAGNLKGQDPGGRQSVRGSALAALSHSAAGAGRSAIRLFAKAARELGYKPFPQPSGNLSRPYVNPLGVRTGRLHLLRLLRMVRLRQLFEGEPADDDPAGAAAQVELQLFATNSEVTRINLDAAGKRATGVTFVDTSGEEWEQPAELVILAAYSMFNVQLLLLSKIGQPYDPVANTGVDWPQLHPPDDLGRGRLLRQGQVQLQSFHGVGRDRHVHRRVQRRQFRPRAARLRRRRLHGPGADGRAPDRDDAGSAGNAAMGRGMEEGGSRQLPEHCRARDWRARQHVFSYRDVYLDLDPTYATGSAVRSCA